jgi:hypothetical protein
MFKAGILLQFPMPSAQLSADGKQGRFGGLTLPIAFQHFFQFAV